MQNQGFGFALPHGWDIWHFLPPLDLPRSLSLILLDSSLFGRLPDFLGLSSKQSLSIFSTGWSYFISPWVSHRICLSVFSAALGFWLGFQLDNHVLAQHLM